MLHDRMHWRDLITGWIAGLDLDSVGFLVAGLFVAVFVVAVGYWKLGGVARRRRGVRTDRVRAPFPQGGRPRS